MDFGIDWNASWDIGWAIGLILLSVAAWLLNLISLPGNWLIVAMLGLYTWLGPEQGRADVGWGAAAVAFVLALVGEIIEFVAGAYGARRVGASRRSTLYAVIGSLIGAITGGIVGVPIPIIGSLVAALLFGAIGATAGAMYGEWTDGKAWRESWTVGHAAFWGRLLGTVGKLSAGAAILGLVFVVVLF